VNEFQTVLNNPGEGRPRENIRLEVERTDREAVFIYEAALGVNATPSIILPFARRLLQKLVVAQVPPTGLVLTTPHSRRIGVQLTRCSAATNKALASSGMLSPENIHSVEVDNMKLGGISQAFAAIHPRALPPVPPPLPSFGRGGIGKVSSLNALLGSVVSAPMAPAPAGLPAPFERPVLVKADPRAPFAPVQHPFLAKKEAVLPTSGNTPLPVEPAIVVAPVRMTGQQPVTLADLDQLAALKTLLQRGLIAPTSACVPESKCRSRENWEADSVESLSSHGSVSPEDHEFRPSKRLCC
jgi:hypothetical protein